jgi:hypothetical protein
MNKLLAGRHYVSAWRPQHLVGLFFLAVLFQQHGRSQQGSDGDPCPEGDQRYDEDWHTLLPQSSILSPNGRAFGDRSHSLQ